MEHAYAYIQPSGIEVLSPVILSAMGIGPLVICSYIVENMYTDHNTALTFRKGDVSSLIETLSFSLGNHGKMMELAKLAKKRAQSTFSWESVVDQHVDLFGIKVDEPRTRAVTPVSSQT